MYASLTDLRDEGASLAEVPDSRALALLEEARSLIDRLTGWFFEPRALTLRLDGRGTPSLELPVPPLRLDGLEIVNGAPLGTTPDLLVIVGAPVLPGFDAPRLTLRYGRRFPRGRGNVVATGLWGFTEADGTALGRTPPAIRRACLLLALKHLPPLNEEASLEARSRWRLVEERTRDQSYRLDPLRPTTPSLTGDPEVDALLTPYMRPSPLGAG